MTSCADLAIEFEHLSGFTPTKNPVYEDLVRFAMYTMMYRIAADFRDGEFHDEIVKQFLPDIQQ